MIRRQDDGYWFLDLGSANGSYINGRRATTSQPLKSGDFIEIGSERFQFESDTDAYIAESGSAATMIDVSSRDALLLVTDIMNFTTLSEKLDPDELAPIIGSWYSDTERILVEHGATVDKFLGDSALAYWLEDSKETRLAALESARELQKSSDEVQEKYADILARVGTGFGVGAAVHCGPTAYGAFSAQQFTLLGDAVNVVFRMEALTRNLGERILVSADVLNGCPEAEVHCRSVGTHQVKGRGKSIEVFALIES